MLATLPRRCQRSHRSGASRGITAVVDDSRPWMHPGTSSRFDSYQRHGRPQESFRAGADRYDSRKVMIATVEAGRLLRSVGFFTTCSGGLFLSFCCFFLPSSVILDFLQSEIVLEGIHPCNVHELPNGKFRLDNLSRLL
jgi:hypothetical protein